MRLPAVFAVLVLADCAPRAALPASAQETAGPRSMLEPVPASAYARAEALLPQHVRKLIPGLSVRPRWIGEISRFWFERQTRDGREYLLVDAAARTMEPLFDRGALISAVARAWCPLLWCAASSSRKCTRGGNRPAGARRQAGSIAGASTASATSASGRMGLLISLRPPWASRGFLSRARRRRRTPGSGSGASSGRAPGHSR